MPQRSPFRATIPGPLSLVSSLSQDRLCWMSTQRSSNDNPHLVSLVVQSKKALQHGEQLCLRASQLSSASARNAVDVLALDARVKWLSDAVSEQLKVRKSVWVLLTLLILHPDPHSSPLRSRRVSNRNVHSCMSKPRSASPRTFRLIFT